MPPLVLVVDDNIGDIRLAQEAFREADPSIVLLVATDGTEALAMLGRESLRPDLILLDLNLTRMDGLEVLAQIKADPKLRTIPTLIFTTSDSTADVSRSEQLGADGYLNKPTHFGAFTSLVRNIIETWLMKGRPPASG